jgi:hypothetical protein
MTFYDLYVFYWIHGYQVFMISKYSNERKKRQLGERFSVWINESIYVYLLKVFDGVVKSSELTIYVRVW